MTPKEQLIEKIHTLSEEQAAALLTIIDIILDPNVMASYKDLLDDAAAELGMSGHDPLL